MFQAVRLWSKLAIEMFRSAKTPGLPARDLQMTPPNALGQFHSWLGPVGLACLVAVVCYCVDRLVYAIGIPPNHVGSFWLGTPFLAAVLLLTPRKLWPLVIVVGMGALAAADLQTGLLPRPTFWIALGNIVELLMATLATQFLLGPAPHLDNVSALGKFVGAAVLLAPAVSGFVGANCAPPGGYWLQWRIWCFADALGFLTLTPAILCWAREGRSWAARRANYFELAALLSLLFAVGSLVFVHSWGTGSPALLYLLLPLLLWGALRLGVKGASTSMIVVAFLAAAGAAEDRGPFAGQGPLNNVLSLQLFLFFAAMPFMVLAAVAADRKCAGESLAAANRRLIEEQERERTRIGRDLHDDVNQRLALLVLEIQELTPLAGGNSDLGERLIDLSRRTSEISSDIQALSHRLHPSKLEYLGLATAAKSFCREIAERQKVDIRFSEDNVPSSMPWERSVCLFRVLQEAVHNAVKHSGVRSFDVQFHGAADGIRLTVTDSGAGFDPATAMEQSGLGLLSMRERLRLVEGTLSVRAKPGAGTTIEAFVPKTLS